MKQEFRSYLHGRSQYIEIGGQHSYRSCITCSVPLKHMKHGKYHVSFETLHEKKNNAMTYVLYTYTQRNASQEAVHLTVIHKIYSHVRYSSHNTVTYA